MSVKAEHYDIIRKPLVTEKSTMASENGRSCLRFLLIVTNPKLKKLLKHYLVLKLRL